MSQTETKSFPPDGGWGWCIVFGGGLINVVIVSLSSQFGLIFGQKMEDMGYQIIGICFVTNVNAILLNFSGLIVGPLLKYFKSRRCISIFSVLLFSSGMVLCSIATNIYHLLLFYSFLTGISRGILTSTIFVIISDYFDKRKSYAVGWSLLGTSIGQLLMPQLIKYLLDEYGYKGTTIILGGLCLNGLLGALLFHPLSWHVHTISIISEWTEKDPLLPKECTKSVDHKKDREVSKWRKFVSIFDFHLLKDLRFIHILIGTSLVHICNLTYGVLLPFILLEDKNFLMDEVTLCMSLQSAADIVGRALFPFLTRSVSSRTSFLIGTIMLAFLRSVFIEQSNFNLVIVTAMLCGFMRSIIVLNQNIILVEYLEDQNLLPSAVGLSMFFKGFFILFVGELFGAMRDFFQSYNVCIHVQSFVLVLISLSWSVELAVTKFRRKRQDNVTNILQ